MPNMKSMNPTTNTMKSEQTPFVDKTQPPVKKFNPNEIFNNSPVSTPMNTNNNNSNNNNNNNNNTPVSNGQFSSQTTKVMSNSHHQNVPQTPTSKVHKIDEKLEKMPWFHGLMTRESAEKVLVKDGDYLVRETNKAERQYVLSGRYKGECRHIFLVDPSGVVRKIL